ncbi:MAG TPA: YicC family protein [Deltaproteobacteria bacterium]|nr:YicC family protein [Deltaproteobacteria bacterium]
MLHSMTGYGRGEASNGDVSVVVELKSVNNRFRDLQLRGPREYMALESRILKLLKEPFHRGRIEVFVRRVPRTPSTRVVADAALAQQYAEVINEVAAEMVGFVVRDVPFTFILQQSGVLAIEESEVDVLSEWTVVETAVGVAIEDMLEMRRAEGQALHDDLGAYLREIAEILDRIEAVAEGINDRVRQRLDARIQRMIGDRADPYRIAQEVAVLADKADVSEEIARMRSHCTQFQDALVSDDPVGRRLDFLLQEMNREVNTIGSKAAEHAISQRVVDLKTVLERMREQSANVE